MTESQKDTQRALAAARALIDDRDLLTDWADVLVTLDQLVATILLVTQGGDHRKAMGMLNEGLVPHVEERIALHARRNTGKES